MHLHAPSSLTSDGAVRLGVLLAACACGGAALSDWRDSAATEDRLVARRVAQRLGEWSAPPLAPAARAAQLDERRQLQADVAAAELRLARRAAKEGRAAGADADAATAAAVAAAAAAVAREAARGEVTRR